jgi:hypothetical protein
MAKARLPRDAQCAAERVTLPLPRSAYLPGGAVEPDRPALQRAKALVPARFHAFVPADDPGFRYGLLLHDTGFFWEAHEIWEAVWMAAPMNGRDRIALRALIQIANARLKRRMGRVQAAARLVEDTKMLLGELIARGPAAETTSVAGRLRAAALNEELSGWSDNRLLRLRGFLEGEKMHESA